VHRRERLDIAPLSLGIEGVEGERGLARAGQPGQHDQALARQVQVDVLEIVGARAAQSEAMHTTTLCSALTLGGLGQCPLTLHLIAGLQARIETLFVQPALDLGETLLEALIGGAQRLFCIHTHMSGQIDAGEQQITDLMDTFGRIGVLGQGRATLGEFFLDLVEDDETSSQSNPTRAARRWSFSARTRAGRVRATPSRIPLGSPASVPARSAALICSQ
jgi:hypothetical protein